MATQGVEMTFKGGQNATFDKDINEDERIRMILGSTIGLISHTKHGYMGGWLTMVYISRPGNDPAFWEHSGLSSSMIN